MISLLEREMLGDPTWTAVLATQVVKIREADAALRRIVPPEECREAHVESLSASGDIVLAVEYALKGVRLVDPNLVDQAEKYFASAAAKGEVFDLMLEALTP